MRILITGGAGFVGCNVASAAANIGWDVVIADNLRRPGSLKNLRWLLDDPAKARRIDFRAVDVRDAQACEEVVREGPVDAVIQLAGQVAATTAITDPVTDFEINARGTLNVLEAMRKHAPEAIILFASTNKVYGTLSQLKTVQEASRYVLPGYDDGLAEDFPISPVTPYGCSKFAAESYVRDYSHTFGLASTVFRCSSIYGLHQNGTVDQGWVSFFVKAAVHGWDIVIDGDGRYVRDMLHVTDLAEAFINAASTRRGAGEVFNVGGGPEYAMSIWREFSQLLAEIVGRQIEVTYAEPRVGDQRVWVSDIRKISRTLGWKPTKSPVDGVREMVEAESRGSR